MISWAGHISVFAELERFVRGFVVLAVVDAVADLGLWDAAIVITSELAVVAFLIFTILFIRSVSAIVLEKSKNFNFRK